MGDNTVINNWAIYIALFSSLASVIAAVVNGIISYKTIKSNNDLAIKKIEYENSLERYKLIDDSYNKALRRFIDETCKYIQIEFISANITVDHKIDFTSAYYTLYAYCDQEKQDSLSYFFNNLMSYEKKEDYTKNKEIADSLLIALHETVNILYSNGFYKEQKKQ